MGEADEAAGMRQLGLAHAVVDQPAGGEIGLVEAGPAGQHAGVDAGGVHHADMGGQIGELRIEQIMRIAVAIEIDRKLARLALEQFRRRVMLLEVDEHAVTLSMPQSCNKSPTPPPWPALVLLCVLLFTVTAFPTEA